MTDVIDEIEARVESLRSWTGPTAVQQGMRELEVVDFMGFIAVSHELIADLLSEVMRLQRHAYAYRDEVKRLREGIKRMAETHEGNSNPYLSDALMEIIEGGAA